MAPLFIGGRRILGTLASDPSSGNSEGDQYYNTTDDVVKFYNGTEWVALGAGSAAGTYTTRGIIFDWDPGNVTGLSDGGSTTNANLVSGINTTNTSGTPAIAVSGGTLTYRTANGGHFDSTSNAGRIIVSGSAIVNSLNACQSITLTCWFQSNGQSRQVLISRYGTGYPNQFNHIVDPTGDFHYNSSGAISGGSGDINSSTDSWSNNTWHLCHWTYNVSDGNAKWYIDGVLKHTVSLGTDGGNGLSVNDPDGFGIMSRADDNERLIGRMGPVRIHNVALVDAECAADFNGQKGRFGL